jgi:hypothetical protein
MALLTARAESDFSPLEASTQTPEREYIRLPLSDLSALAATLK